MNENQKALIKECKGECGEWKPVSEFRDYKGGKENLHPWCNVCYRKYMRKKQKEYRIRKEAKGGYRSGVYIIYGKTLEGKSFIYVGSCKDFKDRKDVHFGKLENNKHENSLLQRIFNEIKAVKGEEIATQSIIFLPILHLHKYVAKTSPKEKEKVRQLAEKSLREKIYFTLRSMGIDNPKEHFLNRNEELNPRKNRKINWYTLERKYLQTPLPITLDSDTYFGEGKTLVPILKELFKKDVPMEQSVEEEC